MWRANAVGVNGIGMAPRPRVRSSMPGPFNATTIAPLSLAMISIGVPAGAMKPNQPIDSYPGRPDSVKVGLINLTHRVLLEGHGMLSGEVGGDPLGEPRPRQSGPTLSLSTEPGKWLSR